MSPHEIPAVNSTQDGKASAGSSQWDRLSRRSPAETVTGALRLTLTERNRIPFDPKNARLVPVDYHGYESSMVAYGVLDPKVIVVSPVQAEDIRLTIHDRFEGFKIQPCVSISVVGLKHGIHPSTSYTFNLKRISSITTKYSAVLSASYKPDDHVTLMTRPSLSYDFRFWTVPEEDRTYERVLLIAVDPRKMVDGKLADKCVYLEPLRFPKGTLAQAFDKDGRLFGSFKDEAVPAKLQDVARTLPAEPAKAASSGKDWVKMPHEANLAGLLSEDPKAALDYINTQIIPDEIMQTLNRSKTVEARYLGAATPVRVKKTGDTISFAFSEIDLGDIAYAQTGTVTVGQIEDGVLKNLTMDKQIGARNKAMLEIKVTPKGYKVVLKRLNFDDQYHEFPIADKSELKTHEAVAHFVSMVDFRGVEAIQQNEAVISIPSGVSPANVDRIVADEKPVDPQEEIGSLLARKVFDEAELAELERGSGKEYEKDKLRERIQASKERIQYLTKSLPFNARRELAKEFPVLQQFVQGEVKPWNRGKGGKDYYNKIRRK